MAAISYYVQRPGEGPVILNACRALVTGTAFDRITGLYAFATNKGVRLLAAAASPSANWSRSHKRWVISIDGGITEPDALRFLLSLRRSEVRIHDAEELLTRRLRPIHRFHPKTLLLERPMSPSRPVGILVGSANLTFNGLCFGHEHAMTVIATGTTAAAAIPSSMLPGLASLELAIASSTAIDADFVDRYEAIRPARPTPPPETEDARADLILQDRPVIPATQSAAARRRRSFVDRHRKCRSQSWPESRGQSESTCNEAHVFSLGSETEHYPEIPRSVAFGFYSKAIPQLATCVLEITKWIN